MNIVTWNMQGGNAATEVKWQTGVANLMANLNPRPDFALIQEAGAVPDSAEPIETQEFIDPTGELTDVEYYSWGGTHSRPGYAIAFHNWDTGGNRVNTAVVSRTFVPPPAPLALIWGAVGPEWRPALGMQVGGGWFFSFHAISPGGADAPGVVAAVPGTAHGAWLIAGDFNREPNPPFPVPAGSAIREPAAPTYSVKNPVRRYDYCVSNVAPRGPGQVIGNIVLSDHFPVFFQF